MKKHLWPIAVILSVSFLARFLFLTQVPVNFSDDEVALAVNANSIVKTGKDLHGNVLPFIWEIGGRREYPFYGILTSISILFFGLNEFGTRFPTALIGALTPLLLYILAQRLFQRRAIAFIAAFLLAVSPWHILLSRWANAAPVVVFFLTLGTERFLAAFHRRMFPWQALLPWTAAILTDMVAWILVPVFMLVLAVFYKSFLRRYFRTWIAWFVILVSISVGLFVQNSDNMHIAIERSIFSSATPASLLSIFGQWIENLFALLSFEFFFFRGDEFLQYTLSDIGILLLGSLPLFFIGIYVLATRMRRHRGIVFGFFLAVSLTVALSRFIPDGRTFLFAAIPIHLLLGIGGRTVIDWARQAWWKRVVIGGLVVVLFYNAILATHLYFVHYARKTASVSTAAFKPMWKFLANHMETYDRIIISKRTHANVYLHGLFYLEIDPRHFQLTGSKDGFDDFTFGDLSLEHFSERRILLLAEEDFRPDVGEEVARFSLANGDTVFVAWDIQR